MTKMRTANAANDEPMDGSGRGLDHHRCRHGRTREEERFGSKMLRIDLANKGEPVRTAVNTLKAAVKILSALIDENIFGLNKLYRELPNAGG